MCQTLKVLEAQERARGPLSPCQVWWSSDFIRRRGGQKHLLNNGSIARSATRRYLRYSEADFEVIRPAEATRCTDEGEICTEEGTFGTEDETKFHPHRCNGKGIGPPKLIFLLTFDQHVEC